MNTRQTDLQQDILVLGSEHMRCISGFEADYLAEIVESCEFLSKNIYLNHQDFVWEF